MSVSRTDLAVLVASIAVATAAFVLGRKAPERPRRERRPALAALPGDAAIAVSIDLARVRQSPLGAALTGGGRELPGVGRLSEVCGFDPTEQAVEVAIGIPAGEPRGGEGPEFGVAASGGFRAEQIATCAARVIERRGGAPARSTLGSFVAVRDREGGPGEIAVRDGGPVLLGGGRYLREMLDVADGRIPSLLADENHATLRRTLAPGAALTATFIARPGWLERLAGTELVRASPLASLRAGALRVELAPRAEVELVLGCPTELGCREIRAVLEGFTDEVRAGLRRELGEDPIRDLRWASEPSAVRLTLALDADATTRAVTKLLARSPLAIPSAPAPSAEPAPDEVVRPK